MPHHHFQPAPAPLPDPIPQQVTKLPAWEAPPEIPPDSSGDATLATIFHDGAWTMLSVAHVVWDGVVIAAELALPFLAFAVFTWCRRNMTEWLALSSFLIHRALAQKWATLLKTREARARRREWNRYSRRTDAQIRREISRLRSRVERQSRIADILMETLENQSPLSKLIGARRLSAAIERRLEHRVALNAAADHVEWLAAEISNARDQRVKERIRRHAIELVDRLKAENAGQAEAALAELNTIAREIDWDSIIPAGIPQSARPRLIKILRQMAGTSSLGEARNAKSQADNIISAHGFTWERMAA